MAAVRRTVVVHRQIVENGVSVDDFPQPGKLDSADGVVRAIALPPIGDGIQLWWTILDRPREEVEMLARNLSRAEIARAQRFGTEPLRLRWIVGRSTLRQLLGRALGLAPSAVILARGRRGRPEVAQQVANGVPNYVENEGASPQDWTAIDFNVSHTRGMALIGIATDWPAGKRIGVDVEHGDREVNADGLARKFLSARERAALAPMEADQRRHGFLRHWTCKEAMSKATGDALSAPFRQLDVTVDGNLALVAGPPPYVPADWTLRAVAMPDGFIATVALWHPDQVNVARSP
ncbi:MAG: 4'-phosphopantetheinyl transferase superfamily protein [Betaproteobacteria bacterium]